MALGDEFLTVPVSNDNIIESSGLARLHLFCFSHQLVAYVGGAQKADGHIERQAGTTVGVACRGKGNVAQGEDQATMGNGRES